MLLTFYISPFQSPRPSQVCVFSICSCTPVCSCVCVQEHSYMQQAEMPQFKYKLMKGKIGAEIVYFHLICHIAWHSLEKIRHLILILGMQKSSI